MRRNRFTRILIAVILLCATSSTLGCAFGEMRWTDPLQREISLEDAQHRYTVLVRFSDFEKASKFVAAEQRSDYLASFPDFRRIRFTEYETGELDFHTDRAGATVEVRYYSPIETVVTEMQEWSRNPGVGNYWVVKSTFSGLEPLLAGN